MPSNQVNVEVDDLSWLVFCRGIVLILVATAEEGIALQLRAGQFDSVLDGASIIYSLCQLSAHHAWECCLDTLSGKVMGGMLTRLHVLCIGDTATLCIVGTRLASR